MNIQLGYKYTTKHGRPIRIYAIDAGGNYPVHGAVLWDERWCQESWTEDGHFFIRGNEYPMDLVLSPQTESKSLKQAGNK